MKRGMVWSVAILALLTVALVAFRSYKQRQVAKRIAITSPNGVASVEKVRLGGVDQWIQIRGHDRTKPLLLFLHGGPGFPEMPFSYVNSALEKDFVVVHWDQRGAGKSYSSDVPADSMNAEQFVSDTRELTDLVTRRFGQRKLFLVAHSWGTLVGALTVSRYPDLFHAYIAIGQVVDPPESERWAYRFAVNLAERAGNKKAISELTKIGLPPYKRVSDYDTMRKWVALFSVQKRYEPSPIKFAWLALCSPVYSWRDLLNIPLGARFSFSHLWQEAFYQTNLMREAPHIEVPVYFLEGRHDYTVTVTAEMAQRYFQALDAPHGKKLIWFENSGHWPHLREPDKYRNVLVTTVLRESELRQRAAVDVRK
jgi:pimeloyl-ACP methyl ester carboxylesterase